MTEVKLKRGEPVDRAFRRLKKKLDREQTLAKIPAAPAFRKAERREAPQGEGSAVLGDAQGPVC
jgi:ribosomal protein S21